MTPSLDADTRISIEDRLMELDGVLHASIDPRSGDIWIVRDLHHEPGPVELAVRNRCASLGHELGHAALRITLPTASEPRRRVRFVDAVREEGQGGVTVTVNIEWNGVVHAGSVTGEKGHAVELKTTALAALDALQKIIHEDLAIRVIGIKQVHAFDSDLMVASMLRVDGVQQRLVGAVIVAGDPISSAALAVLSGLNRTLGNFLHTSD